MTRFRRFGATQAYTVETTEAASLPVQMGYMAGGSIQVPGAVTIDVYASNEEDTTGKVFEKLYDKLGGAVQVVAAVAGVYALPDAVYNAMHIKFVAAAQTATKLCLKS